ncbi:hypothetical protein SAMN02745217_01248 [Anaerocolumna xylanovorans DSM 12503]|uniref:Uncharacterized protein n=1 Tax=Anaerocolumna xylanovorans DSM 12503 TaxID=1121345 RepID=A0A1M7Y3C2_9FIRM|nr:hypothetical protein SAMN02745217_01248 [Anaerocolumna xylanovorans DSM 12503]
MYIDSTNLYIDLTKYNTKAFTSLIASEKYDNCENFYQHLVEKKDIHRFFRKKSDSAKIH